MPSVFIAIAIGMVPLLGSLLSYGIAAAFIVQLVAGLVRSGYTGLGFWKNLAVMTAVMLATAAAHLVQIALWAITLLLLGKSQLLTERFTFRPKTTRHLAMETSFSRTNGDCLVRWRP